MRETARANGVSVKAYAGSTGVLLAMDVTDAKRKGLLGFAIERSGPGGHRWLNGLLDFPGKAHKPGEPVPTVRAPIQKFRWSDYTVYPGKRYQYTVHPVYMRGGEPTPAAGPSLKVSTHRLDRGDHSIIFNRAVAASQAFSRDFPEVEAAIEAARKAKVELQLPARALKWLTRGLLEQIVGFIEDTPKGEGLDVAIYEFELRAIVEAVERASKRGVDVRVVYHARRGDHQTHFNEMSVANLPAASVRPRVTSKICHHKFIVRSKLDGGTRTPTAVLCGSTNFTPNGVYRQGNVVHVVRRPDIAADYLELFEELFAVPNKVSKTRKFIDAGNAIPAEPEFFAGFSPRSQPDDLKRFSELIERAERDVLFCTAFDLNPGIQASLLGTAGDPILRYGLENSPSDITGFHADRSARFTTPAALSKGLEGFLKESFKGQKGAIFIHTKLIVVDFTSDNPTVISGSHNLSKAASEGNDENYLIVRGDTDVADCYGVELMRLYDHYNFRKFMREQAKKAKPAKARQLDTSDGWTKDYFNDKKLKFLDRRRFAGHPAP